MKVLCSTRSFWASEQSFGCPSIPVQECCNFHPKAIFSKFYYLAFDLHRLPVMGLWRVFLASFCKFWSDLANVCPIHFPTHFEHSSFPTQAVVSIKGDQKFHSFFLFFLSFFSLKITSFKNTKTKWGQLFYLKMLSICHWIVFFHLLHETNKASKLFNSIES